MHGLRLIFLILAAAGCVLVWTLFQNPNSARIAQLDQRLVDRHMRPWMDVQDLLANAESTPEQRIEALLAFQAEHPDVQRGDRLYGHWMDSGTRVAQLLLKQGRDAESFGALEAVIAKEPRKLPVRLHLANLLARPGESQDLARAQVHLDFIRQSFPAWEPAQKAHLQVLHLSGQPLLLATEATRILLDDMGAVERTSLLPQGESGASEWAPWLPAESPSAQAPWAGETPVWPAWLQARVRAVPQAQVHLKAWGLPLPGPLPGPQSSGKGAGG